jgi:hypothetical protein
MNSSGSSAALADPMLASVAISGLITIYKAPPPPTATQGQSPTPGANPQAPLANAAGALPGATPAGATTPATTPAGVPGAPPAVATAAADNSQAEVNPDDPDAIPVEKPAPTAEENPDNPDAAPLKPAGSGAAPAESKEAKSKETAPTKEEAPKGAAAKGAETKKGAEVKPADNPDNPDGEADSR